MLPVTTCKCVHVYSAPWAKLNAKVEVECVSRVHLPVREPDEWVMKNSCGCSTYCWLINDRKYCVYISAWYQLFFFLLVFPSSYVCVLVVPWLGFYSVFSSFSFLLFASRVYILIWDFLAGIFCMCVDHPFTSSFSLIYLYCLVWKVI